MAIELGVVTRAEPEIVGDLVRLLEKEGWTARFVDDSGGRDRILAKDESIVSCVVFGYDLSGGAAAKFVELSDADALRAFDRAVECELSLDDDFESFGEELDLDLELDEDAHRVIRAGEEVSLSPTEFNLLRFLMLNQGRVMSKAQILDHVWQYDFGGDGGVVETYIGYLRKKVDTDDPKLIHTIRGVGYTLRDR